MVGKSPSGTSSYRASRATRGKAIVLLPRRREHGLPRCSRNFRRRSGSVETRRSASPGDVFPIRKDAAGNVLCRRCWKRLTGRRRAWCSDTCRDLAMATCYPSFARSLVYRRDRGVCSLCELDTDALADALRQVARSGGGHPTTAHGHVPTLLTLALNYATGPDGWKAAYGFETAATRAVSLAAWKYLAKKRFNVGRSLWEADHSKPVADGGGLCELSDYRTLCVPCHKSVTAHSAKLRARRRREINRSMIGTQQRLPLG